MIVKKWKGLYMKSNSYLKIMNYNEQLYHSEVLRRFARALAFESAAALTQFKVLTKANQIARDPSDLYGVSFRSESGDISLETSIHIEHDESDTIQDIIKANLEYIKDTLDKPYRVNSKVEDQNLTVSPFAFSVTAEEIAEILDLATSNVVHYLGDSGGHERNSKHDVYQIGKHFEKKDDEVASALKQFYSNLLKSVKNVKENSK